MLVSLITNTIPCGDFSLRAKAYCFPFVLFSDVFLKLGWYSENLEPSLCPDYKIIS
jgi:hypothetical protein